MIRGLLHGQNEGMTEAGIHSGDLVVDRSLKPKIGSIAIVLLDGVYKLKRVVKQKRKFLLTDNIPSEAIQITDELNYAIWSMVAFTIHQFV